MPFLAPAAAAASAPAAGAAATAASGIGTAMAGAATAAASGASAAGMAAGTAASVAGGATAAGGLAALHSGMAAPLVAGAGKVSLGSLALNGVKAAASAATNGATDTVASKTLTPGEKATEITKKLVKLGSGPLPQEPQGVSKAGPNFSSVGNTLGQMAQQAPSPAEFKPFADYFGEQMTRM